MALTLHPLGCLAVLYLRASSSIAMMLHIGHAPAPPTYIHHAWSTSGEHSELLTEIFQSLKPGPVAIVPV